MSDDPTDEGPAPALGSRMPWLASAAVPLAAMDLGTGIGFGAAALFDGALLFASRRESKKLRVAWPDIRRTTPNKLVIGREDEVTLELRNRSDKHVSITLRDDVPAELAPSETELQVELPPFARRSVSYNVTPVSRGRFEFGDVHLRLEGGLRIGALLGAANAKAPALVYPNVHAPRQFELAARKGELTRMGVRSIRSRGGGGEFEQLREYVPGDPYRTLDWNATAKRRRPVTRVYRKERSQTVLICVDVGRSMAPSLDGLPKVDHAINAALLLAFVALRGGDRVGLVTFSDRVHNFVAPKPGQRQYASILNGLFDAEPSGTAVEFRRLAEFLRLRARRRALVVVLSDLFGRRHAESLIKAAPLLRKRHIPLCVAMRDNTVQASLTAPCASPSDVYRRAAAADLVSERRSRLAAIRSAKVPVVESDPGDMSLVAVNRYLAIKSSGAL